jgi:Flp pilus assembly protein TadG
MRCQTLRPNRDGAIAPLTAILTIPLLGMIAFAVDLGWITHTKNELQSAADASALAGAAQLPDGFIAYSTASGNPDAQAAILASAKKNATTYAKQYAASNSAADVSSLALLDADIEFGFTDASNNYTPLPAYTGYPNTFKVVLRRDPTANGTLGLFFGRVLGVDCVNLTATASATIFAGNVNSFQTAQPTMMRVLPMAYDVNHWNAFTTSGLGPDGTATMDANGVPQLAAYPSQKYTGNFGELSLDQSNNGASTISAWISYGVSTTDMQQNINAGLLPLSSHNPNSAPDWKGNPGLKTSTIHTAGDNVGQTYLLPLFKPVNDGSSDPSAYQAGTGQGSQFYYTIVAFVAIKISYADNNSIVVQPLAAVDANALLTNVAPAAPPTTRILSIGSATTTASPTTSTQNSGSVTTTFSGAKLTR